MAARKSIVSDQQPAGGGPLGQLGSLLAALGGELGPIKAPVEELSRLLGTGGNIDMAKVVAQAAGLLAWARETVIAPHAGHADPSAHPDCPICRGMSLVEQAPSARFDEPPITWMPVTRTRP